MSFTLQKRKPLLEFSPAPPTFHITRLRTPTSPRIYHMAGTAQSGKAEHLSLYLCYNFLIVIEENQL